MLRKHCRRGNADGGVLRYTLSPNILVLSREYRGPQMRWVKKIIYIHSPIIRNSNQAVARISVVRCSYNFLVDILNFQGTASMALKSRQKPA